MQKVFIPRIQSTEIKEKIKTNKVILINGPRMVGKRTLLESIFNALGRSFQIVNCMDKKELKAFLELGESIEKKSLVLYEAQYLDDLNLEIEKALTIDSWHTLVVCTSYQAEIQKELHSALKNAELEITVYAPSFYETAKFNGLKDETDLLDMRLIYGNYPQVLADIENAESTLMSLLEDVIYTRLNVKDRINKKDKLIRVLQLLAFQVGANISYNDIGGQCGLDNETVERYVDLLEEMNIVFTIRSHFNGNRYEIKKGRCVYFVDNGIRNLLIRNFNSPNFRDDMDKLWANFVISERLKWLKINRIGRDLSFWLTHTNQKVDLIELTESSKKGYVLQYEKRKKAKIPKSFVETYPDIKVSVLNKNTYWNFLTNKR